MRGAYISIAGLISAYALLASPLKYGLGIMICYSTHSDSSIFMCDYSLTYFIFIALAALSVAIGIAWEAKTTHTEKELKLGKMLGTILVYIGAASFLLNAIKVAVFDIYGTDVLFAYMISFAASIIGSEIVAANSRQDSTT